MPTLGNAKKCVLILSKKIFSCRIEIVECLMTIIGLISSNAIEKRLSFILKAVSRLSYGMNKLKPYSAKVGITVTAKFENQDIKNFDLLIW